MKVIVPGHLYELKNLDGDGVQHLQFVQRRDHNAELLPVEFRKEGVVTQEVLRVLIDRTMYLHNEQAWHENVDALNHLRDCLRLYELRAAHRNLQKLGMPERAPHCKTCGHLFCHC